MAHRTFTDAGGATWEVWDVHPGRVFWAGRDRRSGHDRRLLTAAGIHPDEEERRRPDRRGTIAVALGRGWLAFQCGAERRRLAPIPVGWADVAPEVLQRYCQAAAPVGAPR